MNWNLLSLAIVLLGVVETLSAPWGGRHGGRQWRPETRAEQTNYLRRFGHWRGAKDNKGLSDDDDFRRSLKAFQRFAGIKDTGVVDDDTMEVMSTPRCGNPDDNETPGRRKKRYVLSGTKWPMTDLTYFIQNYSPDLPSDVIKSDFAKAFKYWSDVTPLTFNETNNESSANLKIQFASGDHGDGTAFDGRGSVLAHAMYPTNGRIHFDEDEIWTDGPRYNLEQVAAHEFGHALGLGHSDDNSSVMFWYFNYKENFSLTTDDISGIQAIYGKPTRPKAPNALPADNVLTGSATWASSTASTTSAFTLPSTTPPSTTPPSTTPPSTTPPSTTPPSIQSRSTPGIGDLNPLPADNVLTGSATWASSTASTTSAFTTALSSTTPPSTTPPSTTPPSTTPPTTTPPSIQNRPTPGIGDIGSRLGREI